MANTPKERAELCMTVASGLAPKIVKRLTDEAGNVDLRDVACVGATAIMCVMRVALMKNDTLSAPVEELVNVVNEITDAACTLLREQADGLNVMLTLRGVANP